MSQERLAHLCRAVFVVATCVAMLSCSQLPDEVRRDRWRSATLLADGRTVLATAELELIARRSDGTNSFLGGIIEERKRAVAVLLRIDSETGSVEELLRCEPEWDDAAPILTIQGTWNSLVSLRLSKHSRGSPHSVAWAVLDLESNELRVEPPRTEREGEAARFGARVWEDLDYADRSGRKLYRCGHLDGSGPGSTTWLRTADGNWQQLEEDSRPVADRNGVVWLQLGRDGPIIRHDLETLERSPAEEIPTHGLRWREATGYEWAWQSPVVQFRGVEPRELPLAEVSIDAPAGQALRWKVKSEP